MTVDADPTVPLGPYGEPRAARRPDWLPESAYPFRLRSIRLSSGAVTYVDEGRGPTIVFVHTGMWSFVFRDVIRRLRGDFRCVTLDFPGSGLSPDPVGTDFDLSAQADCLAELVIALGLDDVTLVLHDLGGPVGMGFAATAPERVRALVMANTFAWKPDAPSLVRMLRVVSSRPVTALDRATRLVPRLSSGRFGVGRHLDRESRRAFRGPFRDRTRIGRFHASMGDALRADALYARIERGIADGLGDRPVLTVFGEKNDPFGFQARHRALFSDCTSVVVPGGNHFPMMDDPDRFADALRDWWPSR